MAGLLLLELGTVRVINYWTSNTLLRATDKSRTWAS